MSCVRTKYILELKQLQAEFNTISNGITCRMDSAMQQRILFPNFSTLTEKDSMGKKVGNTCFPAVNQSCVQQRHEHQARRTEGMAFKYSDQPLETHETKTVSAVIKSRQLGCFRVSFRVFPGCFRVFPGVSEGFRTKCFVQQKQTQK